MRGSGWNRYAADKAAGRKWVIKKFPDDARITWHEWRQRPDVFADEEDQDENLGTS